MCEVGTIYRKSGRPLRLLILGGTTEASALAGALAGCADIAPLLSFAGRTASPVTQPIPVRVGGFGGVDGLAAFLRQSGVDAVVDATHPFAARMSANAVAACRQAGLPLAVYTRPPFCAVSGDTWNRVADIGAAADALARAGKADEGGLRVLLTTGRLDLAVFRAAPRHLYVIRTIDPPDASALPPRSTVILARPPFSLAGEIALMQEHGIDLLVTKNSGGDAGVAKLAAARALRLPVLMVERPASPAGLTLQSLDAVLAWIEARRSRPGGPINSSG